MMATFSFVFYITFVASSGTATGVLSAALALPLHQQLDLLSRLQTTLQPLTG